MSMRRTNMTQSLLHHDWAYRWERILEIANLAPVPALSKRKERLAERAVMVEEGQLEPK